MNTIKSFKFSMWSDKRGYDMCCIEARNSSLRSSDLSVRDESETGLRYISFYMTREEFYSLVRGKSSSANDIGHNVRAYGDSWTFYDLDFPRATSGVMSVPFVRIDFPRFVQELLLTIATKAWSLYKQAFANGMEEYDMQRACIEFDQKTCDRFVRLYGSGKGKVVLNMSDETRENFNKDMENAQFRDRVEHLKRIALNSTRGFFDCASVRINGGDGDYYWVAGDPSGRTILNGGLILHSRDSANPEWSIHT
jgi:hypothetical protein